GARDGEDPGQEAFAFDRNCLGDRDRTETTRIQDIDLAAHLRLGDGAGKGLAGCGAAAGVGIVANPPDPGPRGLRNHAALEQLERRTKASAFGTNHAVLLNKKVKAAPSRSPTNRAGDRSPTEKSRKAPDTCRAAGPLPRVRNTLAPPRENE